MTNQEAFESARAGDWIAESFARVGDVFDIGGTSTGYSSFADCLTDGQSIFYAAFDENDNREAGLAVWDANARTLTPVEIHATLQAGKFTKGDPDPVPFKSGGTITGTFNATAFNAMWSHVWEKGNPHETEAKDIDQDNTNLLGDTVQEALDKVADFILTGDIDGGIDIDLGDLDGVEDIVLQGRKEPQKVVSEFSFEKEGDSPLTMKNAGMYVGDDYIRHDAKEWVVDPSLNVIGDITAGGDITLNGGNIIIDGGDIVNPDGDPVSGAGLVISDSPPNPIEGMQWLNPNNGLVLFWDGEKWLQMPGGVDGVDGTGFTGGSYDAGAGVVTFTSDDGLGFATGDLRGTDGTGFTGGSYDPSTGVVTFTSDDGLGFDTDDLRGADGGGVDADGNLNANKVVLGNWTIEEVAGELVFSSSGDAVAKITSDGQIVGKDDVTAFGI